jgi:prepilin-type processing-associated H-X9-DG protein
MLFRRELSHAGRAAGLAIKFTLEERTMMLRRVGLTLVLGIAFAGTVQAQAPAKPAGKKLDLAHVPGDAVAAIVAHPHRVFTAPQAKWWPTEIMSAYGKKEMGFDPLNVEQVVVVLSMPQPPVNEPAGFIVRFEKPVDVELVAKKIVRGGKEEKIGGHRGWTPQHEFQPSIAFPNDRTALIATKPYLSLLLAAKPGDGPLHKMLAGADDAPGAALYVAIEPIRPIAAGMMQEFQMFGSDKFQELADLPMTVDTLQVAANFKTGGDGFVFDIKLGTRDADTAENVVGVIKRSFKQAQSLILAQVSGGMEEENSEDLELKLAIMKYVERLGDGILASLDPKAKGSEVTMNAEVQIGPFQLGMLAGTILPDVGASREAAYRNASQNNLKQIALCLLNYEDTHKSLPAVANFDKDGKPLLSWRVHMLPFVEEGALYKEFHLDEPWDSEHNKKLIEKMPDVYKHPKLNEPGKTVYLGVVGKGAAFEGQKGNRLASFTDGTSKTITVIEVAVGKAVPWTKPEDYEFDPEKDVDLSDFGGLWDGDIFNAVFADGHVEALLNNFTDPETVKKMFTRAGGEAFDAP